jgi:hypothetical protein
MEGHHSLTSRRRFFGLCAAAGVGSTIFADTLCAMAEGKPEKKVTIEMIDIAADVAGVNVPADKKEALLSKLNEQRPEYDAIRKLHLPNDVPPAFRFDPVTASRFAPATESAPVRVPVGTPDVPAMADREIPKDSAEGGG